MSEPIRSARGSSRDEDTAAYPYVWIQQSGGWWGNEPIPCRILGNKGMRVKIAALRPDGVELERNVKRESLRPALAEDCCCPSVPCPVHHAHFRGKPLVHEECA